MASKMNNKRLDKTLKDKVNHVQKHNGINVYWDKEGVWKKIQKALSDSTNGPKVIVWYTAMAASVSLLIASSVSITEFSLPFYQEEKVIETEESTDLEKKKTSVIKANALSLPADSMIVPIRSRQFAAPANDTRPRELKTLPDIQSTLDVSKSNTEVGVRMPVQQMKKVNFHLRGGVSANRKFVAPNVQVGISVNLSKNEAIKKRIMMATSVQFLRSVERENLVSNRLKRSYFIRSAYENEKFTNGNFRGWSTGAELMIHSEDNELPDRILKLFYTRSLLKKLRVGPEIMFTNSFRRVYPGLTLSFG